MRLVVWGKVSVILAHEAHEPGQLIAGHAVERRVLNAKCTDVLARDRSSLTTRSTTTTPFRQSFAIRPDAPYTNGDAVRSPGGRDGVF
jgi:hypothetical protein